MVGASRGIEATLLPERKPAYRFHLLEMEPIHRRAWWRNVRWLWLGPRLLIACRKLIQKEKPALVVGTGGYVSGPVLFAAHRAGVPVVLQEQNAYPGLATRLAARWASEIFVGFEEVIPRLERRGLKITVTGNPVRSSDPGDGGSLEIPDGMSTCLVMGGSQGAMRINEAVSNALDAGKLNDVALLWSTGSRTYESYRRHHHPPMRQVKSFWNPIDPAYRAADVVVCRAGAMTIAELQEWALPSILIPLPSAAGDHQTRNARAMETRGAGVHLAEKDLTPETLVRQLEGLLTDRTQLSAMAKAARSGANPGAASTIAARLSALLDAESLS
jgi:UDP-N-acetylglucosamine--N-acetylmuramyl-(pentapeptide) pyrophosphoryl-undecaprenol N-acetylglucosamine transferase